MQRLNELLQVTPAIASPPGATAPAAVAGEVALHGVTFRYPGRLDRTPVLDDVDLTVPAGRTVAIVGRTGAGKSALVQLLPRLFDVEAGSVLLDGRDIRTLPLGWLRRQVGLVPQDPFLFSRTIRENVGLALEGDGDGHVDWAVRMAALARDLEGFPQGLDTVVGERGVTLSGGQKQRVALARALAAAPRVLVLDDALASVDAETERTILDQLRGFFRERTTILVAHRLTTVKEADLICVLDEGRIVELGDHESLLARGGVYADLFLATGDRRVLVRLGCLYVGAIVGDFLSAYGQQYLTMVVAQRSLADLRVAAFARVQRFPMRFFDRNPVGRVVSRLTTDVDVLQEMFAAGAMTILLDVLKLAGIVAFMLSLNWRLALTSLALLPIMILGIDYFRRMARKTYRMIRERIGRINGYLQEVISGMS